MNLTSRQLATAIFSCPKEHSTTHKQNKGQYTQSTKSNLQTPRTVTKQKHTFLHTNQKVSHNTALGHPHTHKRGN